jgi:hypothetical protein
MKSKTYVVQVTETTIVEYEVAAPSRSEAAKDVKKLSREDADASYSSVVKKRTRKITGVITKDLIPGRKEE